MLRLLIKIRLKLGGMRRRAGRLIRRLLVAEIVRRWRRSGNRINGIRQSAVIVAGKVVWFHVGVCVHTGSLLSVKAVVWNLECIKQRLRWSFSLV